jgi:hypothetical protein
MVRSVTNTLAVRRFAAVLVILAAALWWHRWVPAVVVLAFVFWAVLHKWLESEASAGRQRAWRHAWPPATLVLLVLIVGGTALYFGSSAAIEAKILPIALNALAGLMVVAGMCMPLSASPPVPVSPEARAAVAPESAAPAPAA